MVVFVVVVDPTVTVTVLVTSCCGVAFWFIHVSVYVVVTVGYTTCVPRVNTVPPFPPVCEFLTEQLVVFVDDHARDTG